MARKTQRQTKKGAKKPSSSKKKATKSKSGRPKKTSWFRSDEEEILLREARSESEALKAQRSEKLPGGFGQWQVWRTDEEAPVQYDVEIRSRNQRINSCSCPDFQKNRLGFCKHIAFALRKSSRRKSGESKRAELFLGFAEDGTREPQLLVTSPGERFLLESIFERLINDDWSLRTPNAKSIRVLQRRLKKDKASRDTLWISPMIDSWLADEERKERLEGLKANMAASLREAAGKSTFLKHGLYDYQIDGMLHLAFTGRALLADEMGLGKTVQAIAAARVLHDVQGVRRALVITPASLKAEWEEQINKFTDLSTEIVYGNRKERLRIYQSTQAFFVLANYEQIMRDFQEINDLLQPDLVILDEAQRIKNWKTKTARNLKRLEAPYAFVLTGTPLENRIDDLYSLVEFVDPNLFGSLFHFNRRFYADDGEGRASNVANLAELNRLASTVMLRRRKDQISEQLPERIDNNYFVPMTNEQQLRYDEYAATVARLMSAAKRRPLLPKEHEKLQLSLACMRMICDSVYILDQTIRDSPKIKELQSILSELWTDEADRKIIIFSEWVKMLDLVANQLDEDGCEYGWHTGSVPQKKRRVEIKRFKEDANCRILLSSDSGSVGLNLQVASVVINLDLPWNPAKLEQRIARAWRKHQSSTVQVINLVTENTIEHRMLGTLSFKQDLADAVLDGRGDAATLEKPQDRSQFMERLSKIMDRGNPEAPAKAEEVEKPTISPDQQLAEELSVAPPAGLEYCGLSKNQDVVFGVAEHASTTKAQVTAAIGRAFGDHPDNPPPACVIITPEERALLERLTKLGLIETRFSGLVSLVDSQDQADRDRQQAAERKRAATPLREAATRSLKMARLLLSNAFETEALGPLREAAENALHARLVTKGDHLADSRPDQATLLAAAADVPSLHTEHAAAILALLQNEPIAPNAAETAVAILVFES